MQIHGTLIYRGKGTAKNVLGTQRIHLPEYYHKSHRTSSNYQFIPNLSPDTIRHYCTQQPIKIQLYHKNHIIYQR